MQAFLIPAYNPPADFSQLVADLSSRSGWAHILIVNDGSDPESARRIRACAAIAGVRVLDHATNLGKGAALKSGLNYLFATHAELRSVVTLDADGQHRVDDVLRVAATEAAHPGAFVLGTRSFDVAVPWRSRFGNRLTRMVVRLLTGRDLVDTQTGCRAISRALALRMLASSNHGYEFEMEMLMIAIRSGREIREQPIHTVYEPGNASSHFRPILDSLKIYRTLLRRV